VPATFGCRWRWMPAPTVRAVLVDPRMSVRGRRRPRSGILPAQAEAIAPGARSPAGARRLVSVSDFVGLPERTRCGSVSAPSADEIRNAEPLATDPFLAIASAEYRNV
jgi:hypothetical protein